MTPAQRELVRQTLDRLRDEADPVTLLLYGKLFELDPSTRRLFHNDLMAQGRKLIDTLDAVAASLDRFESLRPRLASARTAARQLRRPAGRTTTPWSRLCSGRLVRRWARISTRAPARPGAWPWPPWPPSCRRVL